MSKHCLLRGTPATQPRPFPSHICHHAPHPPNPLAATIFNLMGYEVRALRCLGWLALPCTSPSIATHSPRNDRLLSPRLLPASLAGAIPHAAQPAEAVRTTAAGLLPALTGPPARHWKPCLLIRAAGSLR